uniref:Peptidase M13 N-terminal domain-containing protein n=1 Tax=Strigamia maritima TaxID=126957 RepID=T1IYV3_STRMM
YCSWKSCCILIVFLFILTAIAIGLGLGIPALLKMKDQPALLVGESVERIFQNADLKQDPCTNFYNYACGNFGKDKEFAQSEVKIDVVSEINHKIYHQIEEMLITPKSRHEPSVYLKVKNFYASCMDTGMRTQFELEPLLALMRTLGGWPVMEGEKWKSKNDNWIQLYSALYKNGVAPNFIIDTRVMSDVFNPDKNILYLLEGKLALPIQVFIHGPNKILHAYHQLMSDVAKYFGAEPERAAKEMNEVFEFESKLADAMLNRDESMTKKTINELESSLQNLHLLEFLHAVLPYKIEGKEPILTKHSQFLKKFSNLIARTDMRTFTNYIMWRIVVVSLQFLDNKSIAIYDAFHETIGMQPKDHKTKCLEDTLYFLPSGLSLMYVKNYMPQDIKQTVTNFANNIRDVFLTQIHRMKWLDNATDEKAITKIKQIEFYVAYPEEYSNKELVNDLYKTIIVRNNTFFQNVLTIKLWQYDQELWPLRWPVKTHWNIFTNLLLTKALYNLQINSIELFVNDLKLMFYDEKGPMTFNIGALGSVIGHELFHAIDKKGGQYDANRKLQSWWSHETTLNFINISECFIKKYNSFTEPLSDVQVNGSVSLAENMADFVGVRTAYNAFRKYIESKGGSQRLPKKYPWTEEQLFWLSYANMFCERNIGKYSSWRPSDDHSPNMFRVNGPLTSLPEFVHDFNCNINSDMAMKKLRCKV